MKKILIALATLAMSVTFALSGAPSASADPGLCWNGVIFDACAQVNIPWWGWNNWGWNGGGDDWHGHGHGHGHD